MDTLDDLDDLVGEEDLARMLHDAGREAVRRGLVVNRVPGQPFLGWHEITEEAREGRRVQARYLLRCLTILRRPCEDDTGRTE